MPLVLVVDDEDGLRLLLRVAFETSGHVVHEAENGAEALEQVEREVPDLIVTDVMMPHMSGIELAERLQARVTPVPLIAISADRQKLAEVPADVKIEKPFDPQELVGRPHACWRRRGMRLPLRAKPETTATAVRSAEPYTTTPATTGGQRRGSTELRAAAPGEDRPPLRTPVGGCGAPA